MRICVCVYIFTCACVGGVTLQASTSLEFKVNTRQCGDCAAENSTGNGEPWRAVVQLRQHVEHKRTLMWLEQQVKSVKGEESWRMRWAESV